MGKFLIALILSFTLLACVTNYDFRSDKDKVIIVAASTGLGTGTPLVGEIWKKWAREILDRVKELNDPRVELMLLSSDLNQIKNLEKRTVVLIKERRLYKIILLTHSNGYRDGLYFSEWLAKTYPNRKIDYFAGIDMTLGPAGAKVYCNIKEFDEFHAVLKYAEFAPGCTKKAVNYELFEMHMGHTAAANNSFTQDRMYNEIVQRLK